jgi:hypothetical protein
MADGCWLAGACLLLAALRTTRTRTLAYPASERSRSCSRKQSCSSCFSVLLLQSISHTFDTCHHCHRLAGTCQNMAHVTDLQCVLVLSALLLILASGLFTVHTQQLPATGRTVTLPQK